MSDKRKPISYTKTLDEGDGYLNLPQSSARIKPTVPERPRSSQTDGFLSKIIYQGDPEYRGIPMHLSSSEIVVDQCAKPISAEDAMDALVNANAETYLPQLGVNKTRIAPNCLKEVTTHSANHETCYKLIYTPKEHAFAWPDDATKAVKKLVRSLKAANVDVELAHAKTGDPVAVSDFLDSGSGLTGNDVKLTLTYDKNTQVALAHNLTTAQAALAATPARNR